MCEYDEASAELQKAKEHFLQSRVEELEGQVAKLKATQSTSTDFSIASPYQVLAAPYSTQISFDPSILGIPIHHSSGASLMAGPLSLPPSLDDPSAHWWKHEEVPWNIRNYL